MNTAVTNVTQHLQALALGSCGGAPVRVANLDQIPVENRPGHPQKGDAMGHQFDQRTRFDRPKKPQPKPTSAKKLLKAVKGLGYDMTIHKMGSTYTDKSTAICIPAVGPIHPQVVNSLLMLIGPQNQKRAMMILEHDEVGEAYNRMVETLLSQRPRMKYLLTIETDNIVPSDGHLRLLRSIEQTGFDVMAGLYWAKGMDTFFPMAFGDPSIGQYDAKPRDVREAALKEQVLEVNGCAMGFTLFKLDFLVKLERPWFKTTMEQGSNGKLFGGSSQDLFFCRRIKERGMRIGVSCDTLVGHIDSDNVIW